MSFTDAFLPAMAVQKTRVMHDTWRHLLPEKGREYPGTMLFTKGEYGDCISIKSEFKGLPSSPWFYDAQQDFIFEQAKDKGVLYWFEGKFRRWKNGKMRFSGTVQKMKI